MRKYFKGVNEKAADGWQLAVITGNSNLDENTWIIDTNSLHADQVPGACNDAKLFSQLVSGLLNLYYNGHEIKGRTEEDIINWGTVENEEEIPSPLNPELPFFEIPEVNPLTGFKDNLPF